MANDYSEQAFVDFMEYLRDKGLMKGSTVTARKAAVSKMLSVLDDEEKVDLRAIDVDDLHKRFANLEGKGYKPQSLQVYKSRYKSAIEDFINYVEDPSSYKPTISQREKPSAKNTGKSDTKNKSGGRSGGHMRHQEQNDSVDELIFPIPLRPDVTIKLVGIPADFTEQEAQRVAAVVAALAQK